MLTILQKHISCERGAASVEFAIIIPFLLLLVLGTIFFCTEMYAQSVLTGALNDASRESKTGFPDVLDSGSVNGVRWNSALNIMAKETSGLLNPSKINFNAVAYPDFTSAVNNVGGVSGSLGNANNVVLYSVSYPLLPMPAFLQNYFGINGQITANDMVRNENFVPALPVYLPNLNGPAPAATSGGSTAPSIPQCTAACCPLC